MHVDDIRVFTILIVSLSPRNLFTVVGSSFPHDIYYVHYYYYVFHYYYKSLN